MADSADIRLGLEPGNALKMNVHSCEVRNGLESDLPLLKSLPGPVRDKLPIRVRGSL
jgi:hypothetical protein